jgi:lysophospholipase L1-like esterase
MTTRLTTRGTTRLLTRGTTPGVAKIRTPLAIFGDSITAQNTITETNQFAGFTSAGYATWGMFYAGRQYDLAKRISSVSTEAPDWDFGYSSYSAQQLLDGNRSGDGVYPMTDLATADPESVFVFCGSNGVVGSTTTDAILEIWDTFRAAGRRVFAAEILPRTADAAGYDATALAATYANNATLKAAAAARGIPFLEWASLIATEPGGYGDPEWLPDEVHPGTRGAQRLGVAFAEFISRYFKNDFATPAIGNAAWLTGNPGMSGDVSGGATGFSFGGDISAKSKVTDGDGTVWQRVTVTSGGGTQNTRQTSGTNTAQAGDVVRAVCRIRGVSAGWAIRNIRLRMLRQGDATVFRAGDMHTTTVDTDPLVLLPDGYLMGPEYTIPAATTNLFTYLNFWGSGSVDFREFGIIKVR